MSFVRSLVAAGLLTFSTASYGAAAVNLLIERDDPSAPLGQSLYLVDYANIGDLKTMTPSSQGFLPAFINTFSYSVGGLASDTNGGYHILIERDDPSAPLGQSLYLVDYANVGDLKTMTPSSQGFLPAFINTFSYSVGGLTSDISGGYHLIIERDDPSAPLGQSLYLVDFASLDDLKTMTPTWQGFLPAFINTFSYSVGGLAADPDGGYHVIIERDDPSAPLGQSLYMIDFASLADLKTMTAASQGFLPAFINTFSYSVSDFTIDLVKVVVPVPEPSTWVMLIAGFSMVGGLTRRRKMPLAELKAV
jgi:CRISPR/Cas system endoribonuclease Cas6 (RAMP superfamily)